jgi:hypothetical protein
MHATCCLQGFASSATNFIKSVNNTIDGDRKTLDTGGKFSFFTFQDHNFALMEMGNYTMVKPSYTYVYAATAPSRS